MRANSDILDWAKGRVRGHFIKPSTGEIRGEFSVSNVITYGAADIMARLLGGDQQYRPAYMGFVYGPTEPVALVDPPTSRTQNWAGIGAELALSGNDGNVLIAPFAAGPTYTVDGLATTYTANAVTLTAQTGARLEYGFPNAAPYATELVDGDYFWHAMLLTRIVRGNTIEYIPFARVTLKDSGAYPQKPAGFELALFWQVSYF